MGPTAGSAGASAAADGVPCDVADVVSRRCTGCHQSPPLMGSPMPLLQLSDFQAAAKSDATKKVFQVIPGRFDTQTYYVENFMLNEGDTMTTVCTYNQPATFGQTTENEMCYFFSPAWPAGALRNGNFLATGIHGANSCM